jgi:glycosyltransferase involved in cell wall biosynthesis
MKSAAVFVSVSYVEGQPNTVMEAMACGCPLVVSDIPMHRDLLDERSALLVDPRDPHAIADAIGACLDDPGAARTRADEARRRAAAFSVSAMAERYERLYRACLEKRGR